MKNCSSKLLILIPPSEGKNSGDLNPPLNLSTLSFDSLYSVREMLINSLISYMKSDHDPSKLLGVKTSALNLAISNNLKLLSSGTLPAISRYSGVMYKAIDYHGLNSDERFFFDQNVIIFSGLFGILNPLDLIPNYKLKMGSVISNQKTCAKIWGNPVTDVISNISSNKEIWDLLPTEHSVVCDYSRMKYSKKYSFKFYRDVNGKFKPVTHWTKFLRGSLVRYLCVKKAQNENIDINDILDGFSNQSEYKFQKDMSLVKKNNFTFFFIKKD